MPWIFYAFITAFSLATADALCKRAMARTDEYVVAWVREGYALPFLAIAFFFIDIPPLDKTFWLTLFILLPLEVTALLLYVKAIRFSPLSISIPFMALTPVFIILNAFILLGELPDRSGILGVALIALGAYLMNVRATREGLLEPIKAIGRERGVIFMAIVAFIYSITSTLGKLAVQHSGPIFFGFFYPFVLTIALSMVVGFRGVLHQVVSRPVTFLGIGIFTALMIVSHFLGISMTEVAYMISVKRTSLIFSVIYGWLLFGEAGIGERFLGSALMTAGVILITVF